VIDSETSSLIAKALAKLDMKCGSQSRSFCWESQPTDIYVEIDCMIFVGLVRGG